MLRIKALLLHRRFAWFLAAVAFAVHAPTLRVGYLIDDLAHRYFARGYHMPGGPRGPWDLYRFADGGAGTQEAIDLGMHPWWTDPAIKLAFFRPVTSLLRYAEEAVFGSHAVGPHLVSCFLFVGLTLAVLALMREWIGGAAASLAALLFAIDDAHATTVVWIAARHTTLAALFVVLGLTAFLRARRAGRVSIAAAVLFLLGLCSSESAIGGLAYFAALAWLPTSNDDLRARARALVPVAIVAVIWMGVYVTLGYGARGSAFYVDPVATPARFVEAVILRAPVLALGQLFFPPSEIASMVPRAATALAAFGALFVIGFGALSVRVLGRARALPFAFAFLVSLLPACGTTPDDRVLVLPGVAAFGWLASWARYVAQRTPSFGKRAAIAGATFVHVVLALVLLPMRGLSFAGIFGRIISDGEASLPADQDLRDRDLVLLTAPDGLLPAGMGVKRVLDGGVAPRTYRVLVASPASPCTVTRPAEDTLEVTCERGTLFDPFVGAYTSAPFHAGHRVDTRDLSVEILALHEAHPSAFRFVFHRGLSPDLQRFVVWKGHRFEEITPPAVGGTMVLPAILYDEVMAGPK